MTDSDQLQSYLRLLRQVVAEYERQATSRGRFLQEFDDLITHVEPISPSCAGRLKAEWWTIEQVFATSMDPDLRMPAEQEEAMIRDALLNVKDFIASQIDGPAPRP